MCLLKHESRLALRQCANARPGPMVPLVAKDEKLMLCVYNFFAERVFYCVGGV